MDHKLTERREVKFSLHRIISTERGIIRSRLLIDRDFDIPANWNQEETRKNLSKCFPRPGYPAFWLSTNSIRMAKTIFMIDPKKRREKKWWHK